ncbi:hypothetical protein CCHR01_11543 [Colletotrichum chrysophilum]|uniref:Uncharacterized protein n=1 Tax=Colletotrichum chrysophilum TaxID=1836956 RepID=A0AAD9ACW8_9PEZI|nr:hypothetical protein CCHR01_11543 [Colletotrichum chrysophilum]
MRTCTNSCASSFHGQKKRLSRSSNVSEHPATRWRCSTSCVPPIFSCRDDK